MLSVDDDDDDEIVDNCAKTAPLSKFTLTITTSKMKLVSAFKRT